MQEKIIFLERRRKFIAIRELICGCLTNMALGTSFLYANLIDFMHIRFDSVTKATIPFPLSMIVVGFSLLTSYPLSQKIGVRKMFMLYGPIFVGSLIGVSFLRNFIGFIIVYLFGLAFSLGSLYVLPITCTFEHFPKNKGVAGGILLAAFTFGSFIFGLIANAIINPDNVNFETLSKDSEVDHRISVFFWILSSFSTVAMFFAFLYVNPPKSMNLASFDQSLIHPSLLHKENTVFQENADEKEEPFIKPEEFLQEQVNQKDDVHHIQKDDDFQHKASVNNTEGNLQRKTSNALKYSESFKKSAIFECESMIKARKSVILYQLFIFPLLQGFFGQYVLSKFKSFGISHGHNPQDLTIIGACSMIANAIGRIGSGILMDHFGFKRVYLWCTGLQVIVSATIYYVVDILPLYGLYISLSMISMANITSTVPAYTVVVFGKKVGSPLIAYTFLSFCLSNVISFIFAFTLDGQEMIAFWVGFGFTMICLINGFFLKDRYKWK